MFNIVSAIGILYVLALAYTKRITFMYCIPIIALFGALAFFADSITHEANQSNRVTFYDADLQITVGVYCVNKTVMFKVKDSLRQVDYPLQVFNENAFIGKLSSRLYCEDGVFKTEDGKVLSHNEVLGIILRNVFTGYLPYTASNTVNYLERTTP